MRQLPLHAWCHFFLEDKGMNGKETKAEAWAKLRAISGNLTLKQCDEVARLLRIIKGGGK